MPKRIKSAETIEKDRERSRAFYIAHRERLIEASTRWYKANTRRRADTTRKHKQAIKAETLTIYGGGMAACVGCGEARLDCLSLDHIQNNGKEDRKKAGRGSGVSFYLWLKSRDYPDRDQLQTLCYNCQWLKELYRRGRGAISRSIQSNTNVG